MCDWELWMWHMFFESPGSLNDINFMDNSPTMRDTLSGIFPPRFLHELNGVTRTLLYCLADGIYPNWALFVKTIRRGLPPKEKAFARAPEITRKDIERAFEILMARFHILRRPCRLRYRTVIRNFIKACNIIHNMIVEERRDL